MADNFTGTVDLGLGYELTLDIEVIAPGPWFGVRSATLTATGPNGLTPDDLRWSGAHLDLAVKELLTRNGYPADAWTTHLNAQVTRRPGEPKGEWVARLWREYYQPTGRSQPELADDLGMKLSSVASYCSRHDPLKNG